ncbi:ATP-dependent Clp protease proteolytic subunit, partial [Streptomyces sp. AV19]
MIHDGSGLCVGNAADMREMADLLDRQSDNIAGIYAERAGGTVKQWRTRMLAETWYSAQEAVEAGLADEVAKPTRPGREEEPDDSPVANSWDLSVFRHAGREQAPAPDVRLTDTAGERPEEPPPDAPPESVPPDVSFDPGVFRAALEAAADPMPDYDAEHVRSLMASLATSAPAPPLPAAAPVPHTAARQTPPSAPDPPAPAGEVAVEYFRALMATVANDAPAPEHHTPQPAPPEPVPSIDRTLFERALWEARL